MQYLTHHMLLESANRRPNQSALVHDDCRLDFATLAARASTLAGQLQDMGIGKGERIAIYLKPGLDLPLAILGVSMAGAVFVPVHHGLFPEQVAHILTDCSAAGLITDGQRLAKLEAVIPKAKSLKIIIASDFADDQMAGLPVHTLQYLAQDSRIAVREVCIEKDLAAILYTSGSTGRPKGVMLSHANILAGAEIVSEYLSLSQHDRLLAALPLSFDAGLNQLMTSLLNGSTAVMLDFRFGRDIVQHLAKHEITGLAGVPSLWSLLAQPSSGLAKLPLPSLRYITNTGGAMPQNALQQLRRILPQTSVYLMYGLTEAFRSTYLPPDELDRRPNSMGKAIPNTQILVINEDGKPCQPGETGELVHHGPTVTLGYWGHPDLTEKVLRPHPVPQPGRAQSDLVCYSGDLVKQDEEGFLYFIGRRDNQIKSSGFRISPTEVEDVMCKVAPIRQAAVVGIPDPVLGQAVIGFAVAEEHAGNISPGDIVTRCAARLPRHMVPKEIFVVDELPMTSSGKVNYPALRDRLNSHASDIEEPQTRPQTPPVRNNPARKADLVDS